jgi:hypothetical protein
MQFNQKIFFEQHESIKIEVNEVNPCKSQRIDVFPLLP